MTATHSDEPHSDEPHSDGPHSDGPLLTALHAAIPSLHRWFEKNARDLPWRRTRDPYAIWVSEIMLQQTRVAAVIPYYERWMTRFSEVSDLASAEEAEVLKLWEGLGYYSRARNLHAAAQRVMDDHRGEVPTDYEAFRALPGVGDYTAAAVLSIASDRDRAAVDGNVKRVLSRWAAIELPIDSTKGERQTRELAQALLPPGTGRLHNQAMMELGALVCSPKSPDCEGCPVSEACEARRQGLQRELPRRKPKKKVPHVDVAIGIVMRGDEVFVDQRPYDGMLAGLWEFPGGKLEAQESPMEALARELYEEFGMRAEPTTKLAEVRHAYTHLKVTLHPFVCRYLDRQPAVGEGRPWKWVKLEKLTELAMPTANRRVLESLEAYLA